MKRLLFLSFMALVFPLGFNQVSHAVCSNGGTTPSGGNILNCPAPIQTTPVEVGPDPEDTTNDGDEVNIPTGGGVDVMGSIAVRTGPGDDVVNTSGNIISSTNTALNTEGQADMIFVEEGMIFSGGNTVNDNAIETGGGNDFVRINGGTITSTSGRAITTVLQDDFIEIYGGDISGGLRAIQTSQGDDTLRVFGGNITGGISMDRGSDTVLLAGGTFTNTVLDMGTNNAGLNDIDLVTFAADVELDLVDCIVGGTATLVFAMDVAQNLLSEITDEINNANPAGDSIVINGITYTWVNCQILIANLNSFLTTITLEPVSSTGDVLSDHTVTATVETEQVPTPGVLVSFEVLSGPNVGETSDPGTGECNPDSCETDANGQVTWTYSGTLPGTDRIVASVDDQVVGSLDSNTAEQIWIVVRNIPTLSEWGLMAMAGVLGIIGLLAIRKRKLTA